MPAGMAPKHVPLQKLAQQDLCAGLQRQEGVLVSVLGVLQSDGWEGAVLPACSCFLLLELPVFLTPVPSSSPPLTLAPLCLSPLLFLHPLLLSFILIILPFPHSPLYPSTIRPCKPSISSSLCP